MNESKENSMIADSVSEAALLKSVQEAVKKLEMDFQAKKPAAEELLRESQAVEQGILDMLDNRVRQLVSENTEFEQQVQSLKEHLNVAEEGKAEAEKKVKAALDERAEMEKKLAEVSSSNEALNLEVANLKEELTRTAATAEAAVRERAQYQEKLAQFQENWEKYIAGR